MKPRLYLFIGYPGAGKTTIAQIIASKTNAHHLWADVERHKLFPSPTHSSKESHELYNKLNQATDYLLAQGKSVIFDTNFNHYADREKLRQIADKNKAETVLIWVTTDKKTARDRAVCSGEVRNNYDYSMSAANFDDIVSKLEPPKANEHAIKIDGAKVTPASIIKALNL